MSKSKGSTLSTQNRNNWLIDALLFLGAVVAVLSGIYFLYLPSGGLQGGRNPMYGINILVDRHSWEDLHTWGGAGMIAAVAFHLASHRSWVKMMAKRLINYLRSGRMLLSRKAAGNLLLNALVAVSFLLTAASGIYFLFVPPGGYQGGRNLGWDPGFLFSRTAWDMIHTWAGVAFTLGAVIHFVIHWGWVKKVTKRIFSSGPARSQPHQVPAEVTARS
jgi:hypothetical protein